MARGSFRLEIAEFAKQAGENADLAIEKIVKGIFSGLVEKSPVDTGRFRANWQYSVNAKASGTIDGNWTSKTRAPPPETPKIAAGAFGKVHVIANNLPYAQRLENGHSKQAPIGMVGLTLMEFNSIVSKAAREAREGLGVVGG